MRPNSLAFRLFVAAAAWSLVVLPATAVILISVYRGAVERNFDARLNVYLTALIAGVAVRSDTGSNSLSLSDPSFKLPFSGWYWQMTPLGGPGVAVRTSESLLDQRLELPSTTGTEADANRIRRAYVAGPEKQRLRVLEREISLGSAGETASRLSVAVAGDSAEIDEAIREFRNLLILALSILGAGLLVATFFQVRFGLRPLRAIGKGLSAIRSGEAELLESDLPTEIEPLQIELNALIESNRAIVDRARTHVGNLAHALKTPLSVIMNEAGQGRSALARKVREQTQIMRDQIDHHLNRASIAARSGVVSAHTEVKPVLQGLVRALSRIYSERRFRIDVDCPGDIIFQGEKHDLEEMVGNLLDNACKWAKSSVSVSARHDHDKATITLIVDDDGPGLPEKERLAAMKRGRRLDETKPGSGLGLSIVSELAHLYKGRFSLGTGEKGGLRAHLELPHA